MEESQKVNEVVENCDSRKDVTKPLSDISPGDEKCLTKNPGYTQPNPLSKNQQKKLRKAEQFAKARKERRHKEKERMRLKRQEAKIQGLPQGPTRKELKKKQTASANDAETVQVAIDLDFDDFMTSHDTAKCVKQCLRMYTINRRSPRPAKLHFTGIKHEGKVHQSLKKNHGWENWVVAYHFGKGLCEVFDKQQLVYLTSESDNVLQSLEVGTVYVIGGLVDHNHQKGLCHERATKAGLRTARLPLSENVDMKTRSVLSTYHVFEILSRVNEGKSWLEAIIQTLPLRKGAKVKRACEESPEPVGIQVESNSDKCASDPQMNDTSPVRERLKDNPDKAPQDLHQSNDSPERVIDM